MRQELFGVQQQILREAKKVWGPVGQRVIRPVRVENLHLTLVFLSEVSLGQLEVLRRVAKEVAQKHPRFTFRLKDTDWVFLRRKSLPRMIWVRTEKDTELKFLQKALVKRLAGRQEFGFLENERRPFKPHVTLARLRYCPKLGLSWERLSSVRFVLNLRVPVERIEIMESLLGKEGSRYKVVASYPLGNGIHRV